MEPHVRAFKFGRKNGSGKTVDKWGMYHLTSPHLVQKKYE